LSSSGLVQGTLRVTSQAVPASVSSSCTTGDIAYNATLLYVCVSTNTWRAATLATF